MKYEKDSGFCAGADAGHPGAGRLPTETTRISPHRERATVTADADMVTVTANASVSGKSVADAQEGMNRIIESVTQKLLELGVQPEDLVTTSYTYYPTYDYNGETPTVNGYQANHTLSITCRDVDMLDSVISVVTDCGMSEIYNVEYDVSTRSELYRQALGLAIEAAAEKGRRDGTGSGADD